jgi:hypothetical protein
MVMNGEYLSIWKDAAVVGNPAENRTSYLQNESLEHHTIMTTMNHSTKALNQSVEDCCSSKQFIHRGLYANET